MKPVGWYHRYKFLFCILTLRLSSFYPIHIVINAITALLACAILPIYSEGFFLLRSNWAIDYRLSNPEEGYRIIMRNKTYQKKKEPTQTAFYQPSQVSPIANFEVADFRLTNH